MTDAQSESTPTEGESTAPQVPIVAPPEPDSPPPEPVGRTPEAEAGLPPSDQSQGVGGPPTQDGDSEDGQSGTAFRPSSDFEVAEGDDAGTSGGEA